MGTLRNHQPFQGDKTTIRVAVGKLEPVSQTVTVGVAEPIKGATTITVTALTGPIEKDNSILFEDTNGLEYLAKVTDDAATGDTTLTVAALAEAIPAAATAQFPPELLDRSAADVNASAATQDIYTLNTGGQKQVVATSLSREGSAPGFFFHKNAGLETVRGAFLAKKPVWMVIEYENPDSTVYSKGAITKGKAIISSLNKTSPADGFIEMPVEYSFTGPVTELDPVPLP